MSDFIVVENDGPELLSTNYFETEYARKGYVYLSINAGCFRLLMRTGTGIPLDEIKTGEVVIVTRGTWPETGRVDALELLFDDHSDNPFAMHIVPEQVDRMPLDADRDRKGQAPRWTFAVYTENGKVYEAPARYRKAKRLPCMKGWRDD